MKISINQVVFSSRKQELLKYFSIFYLLLSSSSSFFLLPTLIKYCQYVMYTYINAILLPKLFWPTVRRNCSVIEIFFWNLRLKAKNYKSFSWSLEQSFLTVRQNNFGNKIAFSRGACIADITQRWMKDLLLIKMTYATIRKRPHEIC